MNLLTIDETKRLERHLDGVMQSLPFCGALQCVREPIRSFVMVGGKRIRPQLCLWTRGILAKCLRSGSEEIRQRSSDAVLDFACAWELFHTFLLVHDDLIDAADYRRDRKSLHRQLQAINLHSEQFGRSLAIVAGDLLFSEAMRLFHDAEVPAEMYRDQARLFSRVARLTGFGQAIDICQSQVALADVCEATLLREYHWKTAAYTFEGPMLSGAIAAGAGCEVRDAISRFALALGQAYQMQNDLADLSQPAHDGCDLVQGKRTITLLRYRQTLDAAARDSFDRRFAAIPSLNGHAVGEAELIRQELLMSSAVEQTQFLIDRFLDRAAAAAEEEAVPRSLGDGLQNLLASLRGSYFAPV